MTFQSTPPRGRRPGGGAEGHGTGWFQSTPPRGRRLGSGNLAVFGLQFQSTPPRGRRPPRRCRAGLILWVSIHASAREATTAGWPACWAMSCFNPRLRAGGDSPSGAGRGVDEVSIHASAREATRRPRPPGCARTRFNPRLRAGGDSGSATTTTSRASFNPRLRAGGDQPPRPRIGPATGFNPRLRAGGDGVMITPLSRRGWRGVSANLSAPAGFGSGACRRLAPKCSWLSRLDGSRTSRGSSARLGFAEGAVELRLENVGQRGDRAPIARSHHRSEPVVGLTHGEKLSVDQAREDAKGAADLDSERSTDLACRTVVGQNQGVSRLPHGEAGGFARAQALLDARRPRQFLGREDDLLDEPRVEGGSGAGGVGLPRPP